MIIGVDVRRYAVELLKHIWDLVGTILEDIDNVASSILGYVMGSEIYDIPDEKLGNAVNLSYVI